MPTNGLDGVRVKLPSGRWLADLNLTSITTEEAAFLAAMHMSSHATKGTYIGSMATALTAVMGGAPERLTKSMGRILRLHGYTPTEGPPKGWLVPDAFPASWDIRDDRVRDDGSQTEGGPVTTHRVTKQMDLLMRAISDAHGRTRGDYAAALKWEPINVSSVVATLIKHGYVERVGKTLSVRYYPTGKPFPYLRNRPKPKAADHAVAERVVAQVENADPPTADVHFHRHPKGDGPPSPEVIEAATGGTVVYGKDGQLLVLKDGVLHTAKAVTTWLLTPLT